MWTKQNVPLYRLNATCICTFPPNFISYFLSKCKRKRNIGCSVVRRWTVQTQISCCQRVKQYTVVAASPASISCFPVHVLDFTNCIVFLHLSNCNIEISYLQCLKLFASQCAVSDHEFYWLTVFVFVTTVGLAFAMTSVTAISKKLQRRRPPGSCLHEQFLYQKCGFF